MLTLEKEQTSVLVDSSNKCRSCKFWKVIREPVVRKYLDLPDNYNPCENGDAIKEHEGSNFLYEVKDLKIGGKALITSASYGCTHFESNNE